MPKISQHEKIKHKYTNSWQTAHTNYRNPTNSNSRRNYESEHCPNYKRHFTKSLTKADGNLTLCRAIDSLAWIIHKATSKYCEYAIYTVPKHFLGTFFQIAVWLFDARGKSGVRSRPILLVTFLVRQRATFLRRLADLFSQISSGRRILMNNPG